MNPPLIIQYFVLDVYNKIESSLMVSQWLNIFLFQKKFLSCDERGQIVNLINCLSQDCSHIIRPSCLTLVFAGQLSLSPLSRHWLTSPSCH